MSEEGRIVVRGGVRTIEYAVRLDGTMPAKSFLHDELHEADRKRLLALMTSVSNSGEMHFYNDRLVKQERPPFWTFKHKNCKRGNKKGWRTVWLPFFRHHDRLILTHGFWKPPQSEWPESEFEMAEEIRKEFVEVERRKAEKKP